MSLIVTMRRQKAVWWERNPTPDKFGKYAFQPPVEFKCRWDDTAKEFVSPKIEKLVSRSVVYADRVMKPGDYLCLRAFGADVFKKFSPFAVFQNITDSYLNDGAVVAENGQILEWENQVSTSNLLAVSSDGSTQHLTDDRIPFVRNQGRYFKTEGPTSADRTLIVLVRYSDPNTLSPVTFTGPSILFGKGWGLLVHIDPGQGTERRWGIVINDIGWWPITTPVDGAWTLFTVTLSGTTSTLRMNGVQVLQVESGPDEILDPLESFIQITSPIWNDWMVEESTPTTLDIQSAFMWDRLLTEEEIEEVEGVIRWTPPNLDPRLEPNAFEIRAFDQNPNFRHTDSLKTAFL